MYIWYLLAFVVFLLIELISYNLITIWLAASALLTGIYAYFFPDQIVVHVFIFLVISLVLIVFTKPMVKKLKSTNEKTNADRLIGCEAVVLEKIDSLEGTGQVKVMGQVWSAKSESGTVIETAEKVIVKNIEGVKLVVA